MKKILFIATLLACLTACDKNERKSDPEPDVKEARLVLEWGQSDNIKDYTNPLVAYRINGGDVVVEAPSSKSIDLPFEGGRVEMAFLSQETSKDLATFIAEAKAGEKVSYHFRAAIEITKNGKVAKTAVPFNNTPLSQSMIKDDKGDPTIEADALKMYIFDEFNSGSKYDPSDGKTFKYRYATGNDRKLVLTWDSSIDYPKITDSYEVGNLFQQL